MKRSRFVLHLKCAKLASAANCLTGEESLVRALTEGKDQLNAGPLQVQDKVKPLYCWRSIHLSVRSIAQHAFDLLHKLTWMKRLGQIQVSASFAANGHTPK